jgi:hypothetical protein
MRHSRLPPPSLPHAPSRALPNRALPILAGVLLLAGTGCEPILVTPSRYGTLRVSITMESGAPVAGLGIVLYTGVRPMEYSATDDAGQHTFERVPPGNYGVLGAMPAGLCDERGSAALVRDDLDMTPGLERAVTFTLHPCASPAAVRS